MVKIGTVGLGAWGWNVTRNFAELKSCNLVSCFDVDQKRRESAGRAWPGVKPVDTYEQLLQQDIDAVAIASPAVTHYELVKKALLSGRDVFVEKPFTLNTRDAEELLELSQKLDRVLMVGHLLEYHPVVHRLRKLITSGELGPVYYIYSQRVNLGRIRGDENALWSFAPHDVSQILFLLGMEPTNVSARGQSYIQDGIEDVVFLSLFFDNRIMAHIHLSWLDPHKVRRTTIVGKHKMAVFDDAETTEKLRIYDNHAEMPPAKSYGEAIQVRFGDILIPRVETGEPLKIECQHFIDCVRDHKTPVSDARDGLRVIRIIEAAQQSMEQDGIPVSLRNSNEQLHTPVSASRRWYAVGA
ncbi:MAG TPA: Gfo/Idh/MocA family oxidoreductase [Candidatus Saccharimonadales bacterium]|jgi:predicted dehydrogenase|nr:Gfo/Idh/MocA family oxidoreductase [Candidatus Saccharimonadales bacterium]